MVERRHALEAKGGERRSAASYTGQTFLSFPGTADPTTMQRGGEATLASLAAESPSNG